MSSFEPTISEETDQQASVEHGELGRALLSAGAAWARYGVTIARSSLLASARSLEATADVLDVLIDRMQQIAAAPEPPARES